MPKKVKLEKRFLKALADSKVFYCSRIFNLGSRLYLPTFVFGCLIVEVEEDLTSAKVEVIRAFKKNHKSHKLFLLTEDASKAIEYAGLFDEVFDFKSIKVLISQIEKCRDSRWN